MRRLHHLLRRQDGIALPTVLGALTITTLLAATTFAVSLEGQHSSTRDRDSKRALAAAEAGLQMAYLKLSDVRPTDSQCVTDAAVLPGTGGAAAGECPPFTGQLGNGATYTYVVATPTSGSCPAVPGKATSAKDRCITSIGTVNGVRRRLQTRMYYEPPWKPFMEAGLVARNDVIIRNNETQIHSTVGANGSVSVANGTRVNGGITLGPDADWEFTTGGGTVNNQAPSYRDEPFQFLSTAELDVRYAASRAVNNNGPLNPSFYSSGGRTFTMGTNTTYTLPGGTYNFCSLTLNQGAKLRIPAGQVARVFIDSPKRNGSGCGPATGKFLMAQATEFNREYGADPAQLELYVYGTNADSLDNPGIDVGNAAWLYAAIYAPNASLRLDNGGNVIGAATVNNARVINNSDFIWDNRVLNKTIPGTGASDTRSWFECRRSPTVAADPESGCS